MAIIPDWFKVRKARDAAQEIAAGLRDGSISLEAKTGYMCGTSWGYEMDDPQLVGSAGKIFTSVEEATKDHAYCGVVEVEMHFKRWAVPMQPRDHQDGLFVRPLSLPPSVAKAPFSRFWIQLGMIIALFFGVFLASTGNWWLGLIGAVGWIICVIFWILGPNLRSRSLSKK